ncbi:hypothetical protein BDR05DRAFT_954106, partial [Suillus weaverae]
MPAPQARIRFWWAPLLQTEPDRFRDSTSNHINGKRYHECHDKLHVTGAGIMPQDENTAQNLHAHALKEFPWYDHLAGIIGGNLALSLKTVSSCPGVDHSANYFSISCMIGSLYSESLRSGSAQFSAQPQLPPSGSQPFPPPSGSQPYPSPSGGQPYPPPSGGQPYSPHSGSQPYPPPSSSHSHPLSSSSQPYSPPSSSQPYPSSSSGQPYPPPSRGQPYPPSSSGQPSSNQYYATGTKHHQYSQHLHSGVLPAPSCSVFNLPLDDAGIVVSDYFSSLNCDEGAMDISFHDIPHPTPPMQHDYYNDPNAIILDSPPRSAHAASKWPAPLSSLSPPITPLPQSEFIVPSGSQTSHLDSNTSFRVPELKRHTSSG